MKNPKCLLSGLFYIPKHEKVSDKSFTQILLSSVFGILLCGICLAGLTWAWFSSNVTSVANNITAAKFTVSTSVLEEGNDTPLSQSEEDGRYIFNGLTAGKKYTVTVTADESATATTGFCTVKLGSDTYHTIQLFPAGGDGKPQSLEFTVTASDDSLLAITPQWGTCAVAATAENPHIGSQADEGNHIVNSIGASTKPQATVESVSPEAEQNATKSDTTYTLTDTEQSYTVQQGDTLSEIAKRYGTTADLLSAYNNIKSTAIIQVGATLKIPPASYRVPEAISTQPAAAESTANKPSATEPSATETPKETEEASSTVSIEPSSQEAKPNKTTVSEESEPATDTTEAGADEP